MPEWARGFVLTDIAEVHLLFRELLLVSERLEQLTRRQNLPGAQSALSVAAVARVQRVNGLYADFNRDVQSTAEQAAQMAAKDIRVRLKAMQLRPDTDSSPHLRDLIVCAPISLGKLATGAVGIGDVSVLGRAINRRSPGYGTYWRAQEYGTGGEVPSQVGRVIFGYFMGAGGSDPTPPQAQWAGGGGPHPIFQSAARQRNAGLAGGSVGGVAGGSRGGFGGLGTIGVEIQPKGFIRYGADAAAVWWRERLAIVQQQAVASLQSLPI